MAGTSVLKLKVDDREYNSSLKQAQQGMQHLEQALKDAGKSFKQVDKSVVDYVRGIGQMEAQSKTARGRISEMSNAFIELSTKYKHMSDEVKNSDVGKALAESMQQLKQRTVDAKEELDELSKSLNNINVQDADGGLFSGLTGMMQVFGGNLLAQGVAALTSELTGSVQESLKLAKEGEGIRIAFERLNQPGLLDNLKEATHGTVSELDLMKQAIQFNNFKLPLEDLGTYLAFAQQKAKDTGQSIDDMVNSIVTGLGRQSIQILDNLGISASEIRDRMKEGGDMTQVVADIIREEMSKAGDYVETAADRAARAMAKAKDEMEAMGRTALPIADEVSEMWNTIRNGGITLINTVLTPVANSLKDIQNILRGGASFDVRIPDNVGSNIDDNGNFINKPSNGNWAGFNAQTGQYNDAITSIADIVVTGKAPKKKSGRGGGKTEPTYAADSIAYQEQEVQRLSKLWREAGSSVRDYYAKQLDEAKHKLKVMNGQEKFDPERIQKIESPKDLDLNMGTEIKLPVKLDFGDVTPLRVLEDELARLTEGQQNFGATSKEAWQAYQQKIDETNEKIAEFKGKGVDDDAKSMTKNWNSAASAISAVGSAMSQIEDPMAKVMGTIAQAVATMALSYAQAANSPAVTGSGWGWLAFAATGAATMISSIAAIKQATAGYAAGGMVKGNQYSGDNIPAMLNAGEVVLNHAQVNSLANTLQGTGIGNLNLSATVTGEQIRLVLNNNGMRTGRGEYFTTNFS